MAEAGIDRLSGNSIVSLNEALQKHGGGFQFMDDLSEQLFPSVFGAIKNCLYKPLRKHPLYKEVEFLWTGSTAEGVNIPNFDRHGDGKPNLEFEMDILCVLRDVKVGKSMDSPAMLMKQEDTSEGYFVVYLNDEEYRRTWAPFAIHPSDPKRKGEMYLNPLLIVEDLYKQIEHIFAQIPLLTEKFRLEFNPPAVTLSMSTDFQKITINCDLVVALELPYDCLPREYPSWITVHGKPNWLSEEAWDKAQQQHLYLVGKCSPSGQPKVEWRLSFSVVELILLQELASRFPAALTCYRIFKQIRFWHLKCPHILHSYHLKMVFLQACHRYPPHLWTDNNLAANLLGLLDDVFYCLATKTLSSYFIPQYNLVEGVYSEFLFTLLDKLNDVRKDPIKNVINLER
ncbi:protein MB21D2-like [Stylophora pistillata]|nr:protein MB21D2-like [Stylophora pistillata]